MSKKNSNVILKNGFKEFKDLSKVYFEFRRKLNHFKEKTFLVAVSGGSDSLALTALTRAFYFEKKKKFHYVLVNHNIRKNSSKEAKEVQKLFKRNQIDLKILNNNYKIIKNIQSQARKARYEILCDYCKRNKIKTVLTAHNFEDQVETFFIRLSRGSGLTGLSAMSLISKLDKNTKIVRPLLDVKKKILIKFSINTFGKYFKDPSNRDKKFLRTKVRKLKKSLHESGIDYNQIFKSINHLASSKVILEEYFFKIFKQTVKKVKKEVLIDLKLFVKLNQEFQIKLINASIKMLKKNYYNPRSKKVINLINNIKEDEIAKFTLGGCLFIKKQGQLCLIKEKS
tara:strand:+ start:954 stop:1973 length:1020 start_codon:yes stop_codon:yes gene_type:complete